MSEVGNCWGRPRGSAAEIWSLQLSEYLQATSVNNVVKVQPAAEVLGARNLFGLPAAVTRRFRHARSFFIIPSTVVSLFNSSTSIH